METKDLSKNPGKIRKFCRILAVFLTLTFILIFSSCDELNNLLQQFAAAETTSAPEEPNTSESEITSAPVDETTSPETTASPIEETTTAPEVTTAPTVETTEAPEVTTAPAIETTAAPEVTTAPAIETTEAPEVTTAPVEETTAAPETTSPPPEETEPHAHLFSDWQTLKEPTCENEGEQFRDCSCGERETQTLSALGHTEVIDSAKAATCTECGLTEGSHCSVCFTVTVAQNETPALGHVEVIDSAKAATCTECGLTEGSHCSVCSVVIIEQNTTNALGHKEVADPAKSATCTECGLTEGSHCSVCSAIIVAQKETKALGHKKVTDPAKSATCTEGGLTEGCHCSVCSAVIVAQKKTKALGHKKVTDPAVSATCTECGLTEGSHCSVCATVIVAQKETKALGHKKVTDPAVSATCTECGLTEGSHCSVCATVLVAQKKTEALGHKEVTDPAKSATCTECGLTEGSHCSVCATVIVPQKEISAIGHREVTEKGTAPTDCECGLSDKIFCSVCDLVIKEHTTLFPLGFEVSSNYSNAYGYNFLGTLNKASAMQSFYKAIDEKMSEFHNDTATDIDDSKIIARINYASPGLTYDEAVSVFMIYKNDHPLYYWISNSWSYSSKTINIMAGESYLKGSDRAKHNALIYSSVSEYLKAVENESSVYHITLAFHDMIINSAKYAYKEDGVTSETADWAHNVLGIIEKGAGVCESYAELFQLLLNYCGIENVLVRGTANGGGHAWNLVRLDDGNWYWFDLTWDEIDWVYGVTHSSFCVNDTQDPTENIGRWYITGHPFAERHKPYTSSAFGTKYGYDLPERSDSVFSIDDTMLYDTFTVDGTEYMVIGYDTVYCTRFWGLSGNEPDTLTYNGRTYKVIVD